MKGQRQSILYRFLVSPRFRLARHLVAIGSMAAIVFSQNMHTFGENTAKIGNGMTAVSFINFFALTIVAYLHIYVLAPRYLLRKKYAGYFTLSFLSVLLLVWLKPAQEYLVTEYYGLPHIRSTYFNWVTVLDSISDFTLYMMCITGASVTVMLKGWLAEGDRMRELEVNRLNVELEGIKQQANPALLLQTLTKAAEYAPLEPSRASEMVMLQSKLLRYQLYDGKREKTMLKTEIDHLKEYLRLEHLSDNNFTYEVQTSGEGFRSMIQTLLIMSLTQKVVVAAKESCEPVNLILLLEAHPKKGISIKCRTDRIIGNPDLRKDILRLNYLYGKQYSLVVSDNGFDLTINGEER